MADTEHKEAGWLLAQMNDPQAIRERFFTLAEKSPAARMARTLYQRGDVPIEGALLIALEETWAQYLGLQERTIADFMRRPITPVFVPKDGN